MKRLLFLGLLAVFSCDFAFAQQPQLASFNNAAFNKVGPTRNPKTKRSAVKPAQPTTISSSRGEVYVGYSGTVARVLPGGFAGEKRVHHGAQTSVAANVSRFVGIKGDFSVGYSDHKEGFAVIGRVTTTTRRTVIYNILGGVQFKDNESDAAVQPFGHALVGVGIYRQRFRQCLTNNAPDTFCGTPVKDVGLAGAFGGGLDFRVTNRAAIRLVSDYNPMRIEGETIHNYRFGAGVVFK
jgi:hypothetical protein